MTPLMVVTILQAILATAPDIVKIKQLLDAAQENPEMPDEQWEAVVANVKDAETGWEAATQS